MCCGRTCCFTYHWAFRIIKQIIARLISAWHGMLENVIWFVKCELQVLYHGHGQARRHFGAPKCIICLLFSHFYKKVSPRLSEHGDIIKTQKWYLIYVMYFNKPRLWWGPKTTTLCVHRHALIYKCQYYWELYSRVGWLNDQSSPFSRRNQLLVHNFAL